MVTEGRRTNPPLDQELFEEPYRFEFFQAVRLLERINPELQPVGREGDSTREVVRFRTRQTFSFPASEIHEISRVSADTRAANGEGTELMVSFMGLTGPLGVLPQQYTELLMERARYKDTTLWNFLDIFNHRMISLFYRAWEKYRFPIAYERNRADHFTEYLFDIIGLGTRGLRQRLHLPDQGLLLYSGLIAQRPHSASALQAIIGDYFGVRVEVDQFNGQWIRLEEADLSRLGAFNGSLGVNTVAGTRVWDTQSKFRIQVGPIRLDQFKAFLPTGSAYKPLTSLARFLVGLEFDFDVQLILKAQDVPASRLGDDRDVGPLLGWTSWLKTREFEHDDSQLVLSVKDQP